MARGRIYGLWFVGDGMCKDSVRVIAGRGGCELWRLCALGEARLAGEEVVPKGGRSVQPAERVKSDRGFGMEMGSGFGNAADVLRMDGKFSREEREVEIVPKGGRNDP